MKTGLDQAGSTPSVWDGSGWSLEYDQGLKFVCASMNSFVLAMRRPLHVARAL